MLDTRKPLGRSLLRAIILLFSMCAIPPQALNAGTAFELLRVPREIDPGMTRGQAMAVLESAGLSIEQETVLPPDRTLRLLVAVPRGDECLPPAAVFRCATVRVFLRNDPERGHRVFRVEAFQPVREPTTVAEALQRLGSPLGQPLQTSIRPEIVAGERLIVWRQHWMENANGDVGIEILVAQREDDQGAAALTQGDPNGPAVAVGLVRTGDGIAGGHTPIERHRP